MHQQASPPLSSPLDKSSPPFDGQGFDGARFEQLATELLLRERLHDECGVVGFVGPSDGRSGEYSRLAVQALAGLQHRGLNGAGIASCEHGSQGLGSQSHGTQSGGVRVSLYKDEGKVAEVFTKAFDFNSLPGRMVIGHVRYGTQGGQCKANVQPITLESSRFGTLAVAHNGNLINAAELSARLIASGATLATTSDSELFVQLIEHAPPQLDLTQAIGYAFSQVRGAYSVVLLADGRLFGARDPFGVRPLVVAHLPDGTVGIASETKAFAPWSQPRTRQVLPGELLEVSLNGSVTSTFPSAPARSAFCIFELMYLSYPSSFWNDRSVKQVREALGESLAVCAPPQHTASQAVVVPILNSGLFAAQGFSRKTGLMLDCALMRNTDERTFIQPDQTSRELLTRSKHSLDAVSVVGKAVYLIDDSLVRGTTMRELVKLFHDAGAAEVHVRIACPPIHHPCYYGIATDNPNELLANRVPGIPAMATYIGSNSLGFLSLDEMYRTVAHLLGMSKNTFCDACFTGDYPLGRLESLPVEGRVPLPVI